MSASSIGVAITLGAIGAAVASLRIVRADPDHVATLRFYALAISFPVALLVIIGGVWYAALGGSILDLALANLQGRKIVWNVHMMYLALSCGITFWAAHFISKFADRGGA